MTKEEVIIQFMAGSEGLSGSLAGVNAQVDASSRAMMESQMAANRAAATQYVATWKAAESEKAMMSISGENELQAALTAIDIAAAEKRKLAMIAINAEAGMAMARQQAANAEMSAGSGAFGSIAAGAAGAAGAYQFSKGGQLLGKIGEDGKLIKAAVAAEEGLAEVGHGGSVFSKFLFGLMKTVKGVTQGSVTRIAGGLKGLVGAVGGVVLAAGAIVLAADGVAELLGFNGIFRHVRDYKKASAEKEESEKSLKAKTSTVAEMGETRVAGLERAGIIDKKQAENFKNRLKAKDATPESMGAVYSEITKLMPSSGGKSGLDELEAFDENKKKKKKEADDIKRETEAASKELEGYNIKERTAAEIAADMADRVESIAKLKERSAKLSADAPGKANLELNILLQQVEVEKDKVAQKEKQKELAAQAKMVSEAQLHADEIGQRHNESFMPTLQELAREGGRFGSQADRALEDEKQAKEFYAHGNIAGAKAKIADRDSLYAGLAKSGVIVQDPTERAIEDLNKQLAIHFQGMPGTVKAPAYITPVLK